VQPAESLQSRESHTGQRFWDEHLPGSHFISLAGSLVGGKIVLESSSELKRDTFAHDGKGIDRVDGGVYGRRQASCLYLPQIVPG
jgi:hypothetical protein